MKCDLNEDTCRGRYRYITGFASSKMRLAEFELLLKRGFHRRGSIFYRPNNQDSCCPLYTTNVDIEKFQIDEFQKRQMAYFNEFLNGEHEDKAPKSLTKSWNPRNGKDAYFTNLKEEQSKLKQIIISNIIDVENFISEMLSDEQKESIRQEITVEITNFDKKNNGKVHYKMNIVDLVLAKLQDPMQREELVTSISGFIQDDEDLTKLFILYTEEDKLQDFIVSSRIYPNNEIALKEIDAVETEDENEDEDQKNEEPIENEYGESKYVEEGTEEAISLTSAKHYTKFFKQYVPNNVEESKVVHSYTVSIHPAIWYSETINLYKRFNQIMFNKYPKKSDFNILANSPLFDELDPFFEKIRPLYDDTRMDGWRVFEDCGIYPIFKGTFHVHHRIDDHLFAVNVWDITKHTLGSLYTFYDPDYQFLSIDAICVIREIEYIKMVREKYESIIKYYYVNSCAHDYQKNYFKNSINPKYVMCPFTCAFIELTDEIKEKMKKYKYFKIDTEGVEQNYYDMDRMMDYSHDFRLIYRKDRQAPDEIILFNKVDKNEEKREILTKLVNIHMNLGDELLTKFLFELQ